MKSRADQTGPRLKDVGEFGLVNLMAKRVSSPLLVTDTLPVTFSVTDEGVGDERRTEISEPEPNLS
jgi:hypothetical protein